MFDRAAVRRRGQGGFALLEAVLVLIVASVGILSVTLGLLTSVGLDNRANEQQRLSLALQTFTEAARYSTEQRGAPCGAGSTDPSTANIASVADSHAKQVLEQALAEPEVADWVDERVRFTVTDVEYGDWQHQLSTVPPPEDERFLTAAQIASCPPPGPTGGDPYFPIIRISVAACIEAGGSCSGDAPTLSTQIIERGGRA